MQHRSSSSVRVFFPSFDRAQLLQVLREGLQHLAPLLPLQRVVVFGSHAKGRATVASDIDLMVVYAGERREDAYALTKRTLNIPRLEPHVYSEAEFQAMAPTLERMIEGGVVLL